MARNEGKKDGTENKVLFPVVVASDADENTVLGACKHQHRLQEARTSNRTFMKFSIIRRKFITTVNQSACASLASDGS